MCTVKTDLVRMQCQLLKLMIRRIENGYLTLVTTCLLTSVHQVASYEEQFHCPNLRYYSGDWRMFIITWHMIVVSFLSARFTNRYLITSFWFVCLYCLTTGFVLYRKNIPILSYSGDSGLEEKLYANLFKAPTIILDGRLSDKTIAEHASVSRLYQKENMVQLLNPCADHLFAVYFSLICGFHFSASVCTAWALCRWQEG